MRLENIRKKLLPILRHHKIAKAGLFGSAARGEMKKNSDIDIAVEINSNISLLDFIGIKIEMEQALGKKVDLVEYCAIKPSLLDFILSEEVTLL